jgi:hypothetical protein
MSAGVAVLALLSAPVPVRAADKAGDGDLRQRVERLEEQLKERSGGTKLGGHFGFVIPLSTWEDGQEPVTANDDFAIGFPMGITVKKDGPLAFDLELVPAINDHDVSVTIHPGVLYALDENWTAGLRMAFEVDRRAWGFTPLINRKLFDLTESSHLFIEFPLPIRIKDDSTSVTAAVHLGIGF